jgi:hypothetical protein
MPEGNLNRATLRQGRGGDGQGEAGGGQAEGAALHAVFSHVGFCWLAAGRLLVLQFNGKFMTDT